MSLPFYTIGHSTRAAEEFVGMLREAGVTLVADVRSVPFSRRNPQYSRDVLPGILGLHQIGYTHIAALGGLRGRSPGVPPDVNAFWDNEGFHNYADYAMGDDFRAGLESLRELGRGQRCAVMCAEALWWKCHRRIVTDYLLAAGEQVIHLMAPGKEQPAYMTPAACMPVPGKLEYPEYPLERSSL